MNIATKANVNARIDFVDVAKGISIILVAINHSKLYEFFPKINELIGLVRMPLFFYVSGLFLSTAAPYYSFFLKKLRGLLQPYFITLASVFLASTFFTSNMQIEYIWGIFYGVGDTIAWTAAWFLPHLFLLSVSSFWLIKVSKSSKALSILTFVFIAIGYISLSRIFDITNNINISWWPHGVSGLPFSLDLLPFSILFFILGNFTKPSITRLNLGSFPAAILVLIVLLVVFDNSNPDINLNQRVLAEPLPVLICAVSGIYLILFTSFRLSKCEKMNLLFKYFGRASLYILIFHGPIMFWSYYYAERGLFHLGIEKTTILTLAISVFSFLAGIMLPPLIKRINIVKKLLSPYG